MASQTRESRWTARRALTTGNAGTQDKRELCEDLPVSALGDFALIGLRRLVLGLRELVGLLSAGLAGVSVISALLS